MPPTWTAPLPTPATVAPAAGGLAASMAAAVPPAMEEPPLCGESCTNLVFVASEMAPWSKTGGLGDVMGALPKAMAKRGHRVMAIAPRCVSCSVVLRWWSSNMDR